VLHLTRQPLRRRRQAGSDGQPARSEEQRRFATGAILRRRQRPLQRDIERHVTGKLRQQRIDVLAVPLALDCGNADAAAQHLGAQRTDEWQDSLAGGASAAEHQHTGGTRTTRRLQHPRQATPQVLRQQQQLALLVGGDELQQIRPAARRQRRHQPVGGRIAKDGDAQRPAPADRSLPPIQAQIGRTREVDAAAEQQPEQPRHVRQHGRPVGGAGLRVDLEPQQRAPCIPARQAARAEGIPGSDELLRRRQRGATGGDRRQDGGEVLEPQDGDFAGGGAKAARGGQRRPPGAPDTEQRSGGHGAGERLLRQTGTPGPEQRSAHPSLPACHPFVIGTRPPLPPRLRSCLPPAGDCAQPRRRYPATAIMLQIEAAARRPHSRRQLRHRLSARCPPGGDCNEN
jgi:hypothetical protein